MDNSCLIKLLDSLGLGMRIVDTFSFPILEVFWWAQTANQCFDEN